MESSLFFFFLYPWWAIYRESKGIIVPWKYRNRLNRICLNPESSLAARLRSASVKLEMAGRLIFLICFDPFHIVERSLLISLLVLRESRDCGNQLPNLISDLILIGFDLIRSDLIWRFDWSKLTIADQQRSCRIELTAELEGACGEVRRQLFSGARYRLWRSYRTCFCAVACGFRQS